MSQADTIRGIEDLELIHLQLDGSGSKGMNVDGSATDQIFEYSPPANKDFVWSRLMVHMEDTAISQAKFGGIAALANGLLLKVYKANGVDILKDLLDGVPIKSNGDFGHLVGTDVFIGSGNDVVLARWTVAESGARIRIKNGQKIRAIVQDDLTGINSFHIMVQGYLTGTNTPNTIID